MTRMVRCKPMATSYLTPRRADPRGQHRLWSEPSRPSGGDTAGEFPHGDRGTGGRGDQRRDVG